ncbi:hypothetical protein MD484_g5785, partial [Candolleomyces efflorescens]
MSRGSPFSQHLNTNYVPSATEIHQIRSLADEQQKVVDALNVEIEALVKRRDEHAKLVKELSALLSPVRRVPNDILSLIFLACLPCNSSGQRATRLSSDHPVLVISGVCQRWRHLSLNTPLLWTVIDIRTPWIHLRQDSGHNEMMHWEQKMQAILTMTQLWISRSANCALTVSFIGGLDFPDTTDTLTETILSARERVRSIVNVLCDVSCRWKTVYLGVKVGGDAPVNEFFHIPSDKIPLLETLYVDTSLPSSDAINQSPQREQLLEMMTGTGLVKAPHLCRLGLGLVWSYPLSIPVKWAHLTELCVELILHSANDFSSPFFNTLAMCINLTKCSIHLPTSVRLHHDRFLTNLANLSTSIAPNYIRRSGVCLLAKLRTLELQGIEPPPSFVANLDLPSLQELTASFSRSRATEQGIDGCLTELVRKFGDGLTDVVLECESLNKVRLLNILQHLPNVVNLRLVVSTPSYGRMPIYHLSDDILHSLSEKLLSRSRDSNDGGVAGGMCYCPKLKKFGCKLQEDREVSEEAFAQFIASRRNRLNTDVALLTSFVAVFAWPKPRQLIQTRLQEMGVDLEDMVLITAYDKDEEWHPDAPIESPPGIDVDDVTRDNEDYLSTVDPFIRTLGDLTL